VDWLSSSEETRLESLPHTPPNFGMLLKGGISLRNSFPISLKLNFERSVATFDFFFPEFSDFSDLSEPSDFEFRSLGRAGSVVDLLFVTLGMLRKLDLDAGDDISSRWAARGFGFGIGSASSAS
jgi:hypothetical protein